MTAAMPMGTAHAPSLPTHDYPARVASERPPFDGIDIAGFAAAAVMALLPLTTYAVGL